MAAENVSSSIDVTLWWKSHEDRLPHWAKAFHALVQPSSAAAKMVFSIHFYWTIFLLYVGTYFKYAHIIPIQSTDNLACIIILYLTVSEL